MPSFSVSRIHFTVADRILTYVLYCRPLKVRGKSDGNPVLYFAKVTKQKEVRQRVPTDFKSCLCGVCGCHFFPSAHMHSKVPAS